ncbi:hypothetical protein [Advenella sp. S44]|uniref:hypothetical protein n=1 Tax=Advenella sp. S44 TaxID=1982755 RepID=UPI001865030B|nr:hypothetical protein [Advenella sp. S44]
MATCIVKDVVLVGMGKRPDHGKMAGQPGYFGLPCNACCGAGQHALAGGQYMARDCGLSRRIFYYY